MKAIISLVVLVLLVFSGMAHAQDHAWKHFGADKAYVDRAAAIADAPRVLKQAGYPAEVISLLTKQMAHPGTRTFVSNSMKLDFMRSGKRALWRNVLVAFEKPPVPNMSYSAPSEEWSVTWHGQAWTVGIPDVCRNLYGKKSPAPTLALAEPRCVELSFDAPIGGNVRWGVGSTNGPLAPSACNAQEQGDGPWKAWYGQCDVCVPAIAYIQGILGATAEVPHKYLYQVGQSHQTLRFSSEIQKEMIYICLEDAEGHRTCGVYMRPQDWKGRMDVTIPESDWVWHEESCPS